MACVTRCFMALLVFSACGDDSRRGDLLDASADTGEDGADAGTCGVCDEGRPVCVEATGECVECENENDCDAGFFCSMGACEAPFCDAVRPCLAPALPVCVDTRCNACVTLEDCEAFPGTICSEGTCQQPPEDPTCRPCTRDSECDDGVCILMRFTGELLEQAFCAREAPPGSAECPEARFPMRLRGRASVDGTTVGDFCSIDESVTTCTAVLDARNGKTCVDLAECGEAEALDSRCEGGVCSQRCRRSSDCPGACWDGEATAEDMNPPPAESLFCAATR